MNYKENIHIYKQLNFEERANIAFLLNNLRLSFREIARKLNRDASTISREVKRNSINGKYFADKANLKYLKDLKQNLLKSKTNSLILWNISENILIRNDTE